MIPREVRRRDNNDQPSSLHALLAPSVGAHVVDVRWATTSEISRANGAQRKLSVVEI